MANDRIFRRDTQSNGVPSRKKDEHARKRNKIINFRVTAQEYDLINKRISLSGKDRDDFFIQSCLYQTILVRGNIKSFTAINRELEQLKLFNDIRDLTEEELVALKTIVEIIEKRMKQ